MKKAMVVVSLLLLAGCGQSGDEPNAGSSGSVRVPDEVTASPTVAPTKTRSASPSAVTTTRQPKPTPTASGPGDLSFCDYLEKTADAQQQVEDPGQFVTLVEGALAVAPGAIADDLALYAASVRKLAATVTAPPDEARKADRWLTRNDAAVQQAQANLNSYSESTCGRPFITGEG